jgi:8-oxo-dGTP diphosphatase
LVNSDDTHVEKAAGAFLLRDGEVLLGLRAPHKTFPNCWDMFGGLIESDETEVEALIRELDEELGIYPTQFRKIQHLTLKQDIYCFDLAIYEVTTWTGGEPAMLGNEHTNIKWFTLQDAMKLPNLAASQIKAVLQALA